MYSCKKVSQLKCEAEVRKLSISEKMGLAMHMLLCAGCKKIEKQMDFIRKASYQLGKYHLSEKECSHCLSDQAKNRIATAMDTQRQDPDK